MGDVDLLRLPYTVDRKSPGYAQSNDSASQAMRTVAISWLAQGFVRSLKSSAVETTRLLQGSSSVFLHVPSRGICPLSPDGRADSRVAALIRMQASSHLGWEAFGEMDANRVASGLLTQSSHKLPPILQPLSARRPRPKSINRATANSNFGNCSSVREVGSLISQHNRYSRAFEPALQPRMGPLFGLHKSDTAYNS